MTDRAKGFTITLEQDIRVDNMDYVLNALKMVKGVADVKPIINDSSTFVAERRLATELRDKLYDFIDKELK